MELGCECKAKNGRKMVDLDSDTVSVIKVLDAQVLRIVSGALLLAIVLAVMLFLGAIAKEFPLNSYSLVVSWFEDAAIINAEMLSLVMRDLGEEGLFKRDGKALVVNPPHGFEGGDVDVVMDSDLVSHSFFHDESYDFVFTPNFQDANNFADHILKVDGIVAFPLSIDPSHDDGGFRKLPNYKVVFLQRYGSMVVALRKIGMANKMVEEDSDSSSPKRKLFQLATEEAKTKALKGLEDVLLEPPSKASRKNLKIKYLPDLLGGSLRAYKRRVFVTVGMNEENKGAIQWFEKNYPKKSAKFEIHSLMVEPENPAALRTDVSSWLSKHVKEGEYVVMKAEADVVEEMMKKNTMPLVDELFLECNNEWWQTKKTRNSGRAYWECLALYGRLRDEGVAVHQWWG